MSETGTVGDVLKQPSKLDLIEWDVLIPGVLICVFLCVIFITLNNFYFTKAGKDVKTRSSYVPPKKSE